MAMEERAAAIGILERLDDFGSDQRCGERQNAAGKRFRGTHEVGHDAGSLMCPKRSGAATAGHHLVGNEEDTVPLRDLDDLPQRFR